jgi:Flp pilus assembly protein TadG
VILFPALIALIFTAIQGGLWYHARTVASYAASEGVRAGSSYGATAGRGESAAVNLINAAGSRSLINPNVSVSRGATTITVTVTGRSPQLLPLLRLPAIHQQAEGTVERFTSWSSP